MINSCSKPEKAVDIPETLDAGKISAVPLKLVGPEILRLSIGDTKSVPVQMAAMVDTIAPVAPHVPAELFCDPVRFKLPLA